MGIEYVRTAIAARKSFFQPQLKPLEILIIHKTYSYNNLRTFPYLARRVHITLHILFSKFFSLHVQDTITK